MKKNLLTLLLLLLVTLSSFAQVAQEEMMELDKTQLQGYAIIIPHVDIDVVNAAVKERFEKIQGLKPTKQGNFKAYLNQQFPAFGTMNYDIFVRVLETGKKATKTTSLQMIVCKGNMNAVTKDQDPELVVKIMDFLNAFPQFVSEYYEKQQVIILNNNLTKLTKEHEALVKEKDKLQKEMSALDQKISEKSVEINKAKDALNNLKATTKNVPQK